MTTPHSTAILMNSVSASDNRLDSGELAPGGTVSGQVVLLDPTFRFSSDRMAWLNQVG